MLRGARHRDAAVGAFVLDVGGRHGACCYWFIGRIYRCAGRLVVGVRAVGVFAHELGAAPDVGGRGVGEGVEEVVGLEEDAAVLLVRIVFICLAATGVLVERCGLLLRLLVLLYGGSALSAGGVDLALFGWLFGGGGGEGAVGEGQGAVGGVERLP